MCIFEFLFVLCLFVLCFVGMLFYGDSHCESPTPSCWTYHEPYMIMEGMCSCSGHWQECDTVDGRNPAPPKKP